MELNTARVFVTDIDAARQFYAVQLGLPLKADGSQHGYCVFKAGSADLVIEAVADDAAPQDRMLVGRFTGLSFTVQNIAVKHRELVALGVPFTGPPEQQFWGGILATLQDPSGNELQIVQQPASAQTRASSDALLQGSCHCGAVKLTLPSAPTVATDCNCSLCRRVGGLWSYFEFGTVHVEGHPQETDEYIWGDKTLRTIRCRTCGSVTHWEPLSPEPGARHGVNLRNFAPGLRAGVRVRRFDGADTWTFLDE